DVDVDQPPQLARQVLDVNTRAAVDVGRVLAGEQRDLHASTVAPFGMTTTPPAETVKRSPSASGSTPIVAPSAMRTLLATIARRTTALRPTSTPCMRTESVTSA